MTTSKFNGTIHLIRVPANVCAGRDHYDDELYQESQRMKRAGISGVVDTTEGVASFSGNANCKRCLAWLRANSPRRERMAKKKA